MIVNNTTGIVLYGDGWKLTSSGAINESKNKRDPRTTTANATQHNAQPPKPFVGGHYTYNGSVFGYTAAGLEATIEAAKDTAQLIRNGLMYGGVEYMGGMFKTDAISAAEVHGQSMFYALPDNNPSTSPDAEWLLPHPAGHGGRWRTMDNGFVSMTLTEFHGLSKRLREYERNVSQQAHIVKGAKGINGAPDTPGLLDVCTTKAEIDQVLEDFRNYVA